MVCMRQIAKSTSKTTPHSNVDTAANLSTEAAIDIAKHTVMDFDEEGDRLQLQHLAGNDIVAQPPLYAPNGEYLFILRDKIINVYAINTGELARQLTGSAAKLISLEIDLKKQNILVACTNTGEVMRWDWNKGHLVGKQQLHLPEGEVKTFNQLNFYGNSETAYAFVTVKAANKPVQWFVMNTSTGKPKHVPCNKLVLKMKTPSVAVDTKLFKYIVIVQSFYIWFLSYETWQWTRLQSAHKVPFTIVRAHPKEEMVATGDELGRVFLWREWHDQQAVKTSLYHWHHTAITSIAFSASGSSFYSSGEEAVLVKWNVQRPELREFVPRMCAIIRHIAVSHYNTQVAVCTADNGVQIVGNDNKLKSTLQEFTYIHDDKTQRSKFPVGLRLNPRTNTLVLNGRIGHLQFYSAYTRSLLYNLDIVVQNRLSMETGKILYNINVTKAAFNIDWMATGEVFNDEEHLPELRLKFWKYEEQTQSYTLNTNIELPHEGGFKAIEFSNDYQVDSLLCATIGEDNTIKMWSLDESDNIYKSGKVWYCVAQANYKNMPIESICFSQDGSLLAAGFGNTLCIYRARELKLKAALAGAAGMDGGVQKSQVCVSKHNGNGSKNELIEQRKRIMQLFTKLLDTNEETLVKEIQKTLSLSSRMQETPKPLAAIDDKQKAYLFNKVQQMHELNLYQKVLLYQKLNIRCRVHPQWQTQMAAYLREAVAPARQHEKVTQLHERLHRINLRERFKAKYRLHQYTTRKHNYDTAITQNLVPIMAVLNLSENSKQRNTKSNTETTIPNELLSAKAKENKPTIVLPSLKTSAQIRHVQFAAGEYAHLVVVCTETRVLIWNLLSLRLQAVLKLSVAHLTFDAQTNLIAAFTKNNELHVFQPNVPLPIYQRRHMPKIHGAVWLPRRFPKQRSINVDWQAQSTLVFLTEQQEILYLGSSSDLAADAPPPILFANAASDGLRYSTFGTFAANQHSDKQTANAKQNGPLITSSSGKNAVKSLIEMSTHTMPPLSLICGDFVKSLVKIAESPAASTSTPNADNQLTNGNDHSNSNNKGAVQLSNGYAAHAESAQENAEDDDDVHDAAIQMRKTLLTKTAELSQAAAQSGSKTKAPLPLNAEAQLQRIAAQNLELEF